MGFGPRPLCSKVDSVSSALQLRRGGCQGPGAGGMREPGPPTGVRQTPWEDWIWVWGCTEEVTAEQTVTCLWELAGPRGADGCSGQRERLVGNPRGFQGAGVFVGGGEKPWS